MTTALVQRSIDFYGDDLVVIHQDGSDYTPVKPVCDILGIDWESQRERIQSDEVLGAVAQTITLLKPGDARSYPMLCLPIDYLHGWMFGVNAFRILPSLRERLVLYKRECYRALARAFGATGEGAAPLAWVAALEERVAVLERAQRRGAVHHLAVPPIFNLLDIIIITNDTTDMRTTTEISHALAARGIRSGYSQRGQLMLIAQLLRQLGCRPVSRRQTMQQYGGLHRAWAGLRLQRHDD